MAWTKPMISTEISVGLEINSALALRSNLELQKTN